MKPYQRMFDAYVDPEEDVVFISDPLFTIRKPRHHFMTAESSSQLKRIAFTSEIYNGLAESFEEFPKLCQRPASILRQLKSLTHFTLVLSDEGADFDYDEDDDEDEEGNEQEGLNINYLDIPEGLGEEEIELNDDEIDEALEDNFIIEKFYGDLEEEAMERMAKEYFRHVGPIHFESALAHPDHWESWEIYRDEVKSSCEQEKKEFPDWIRPKSAVMAIRYGLLSPGDFLTTIHLMGDHNDDVVEEDDGPDADVIDDSSSDSSI